MWPQLDSHGELWSMSCASGLVLLGSQGTSLEFLHISLLLVAGCWARRACGMDPPRGGSYSAKGNSLEKGVAVNF